MGTRAALLVLLAVAVVLGVAGCTATATATATASASATGPVAQALPPEPAGSPQARPAAAVPTVGALFPAGLDSAHTCTGSVLDSPGGDLVLTAAHCVLGTGPGMLFVPGYDDGAHPDGVYEVQRVWADPAWVNGSDPRYDYAILQVSERDTGSGARRLQDVTGALRLTGRTPTAGTSVQVTGYVGGLLDRPITCDPVVELTQTYPGFRCGGFATGTSGSPLVVGTDPAGVAVGTDPAGVVVGVIGGLHQGGCVDQVSYSSPFADGARQLLARAAAGGPGDTLPQSDGDGC